MFTFLVSKHPVEYHRFKYRRYIFPDNSTSNSKGTWGYLKSRIRKTIQDESVLPVTTCIQDHRPRWTRLSLATSKNTLSSITRHWEKREPQCSSKRRIKRTERVVRTRTRIGWKSGRIFFNYFIISTKFWRVGRILQDSSSDLCLPSMKCQRFSWLVQDSFSNLYMSPTQCQRICHIVQNSFGTRARPHNCFFSFTASHLSFIQV